MHRAARVIFMVVIVAAATRFIGSVVVVVVRGNPCIGQVKAIALDIMWNHGTGRSNAEFCYVCKYVCISEIQY
jgi:hypothetical protein